MSSSNNGSDLIKQIKRYQNGITQINQSDHDYTKQVLHYLNKLSKLPIKMVELETTGIGKTVNALRKLKGHVGEESAFLVAKWKAIVTKQMATEEENEKHSCNNDDHNGYSDDKQHKTNGKAGKTNHSISDEGNNADNKKKNTATKSKHSDKKHKRRHSGSVESDDSSDSNSSKRLKSEDELQREKSFDMDRYDNDLGDIDMDVQKLCENAYNANDNGIDDDDDDNNNLVDNDDDSDRRYSDDMVEEYEPVIVEAAAVQEPKKSKSKSSSDKRDHRRKESDNRIANHDHRHHRRHHRGSDDDDDEEEYEPVMVSPKETTSPIDNEPPKKKHHHKDKDTTTTTTVDKKHRNTEPSSKHHKSNGHHESKSRSGHSSKSSSHHRHDKERKGSGDEKRKRSADEESHHHRHHKSSSSSSSKAKSDKKDKEKSSSSSSSKSKHHHSSGKESRSDGKSKHRTGSSHSSTKESSSKAAPNHVAADDDFGAALMSIPNTTSTNVQKKRSTSSRSSANHDDISPKSFTSNARTSDSGEYHVPLPDEDFKLNHVDFETEYSPPSNGTFKNHNKNSSPYACKDEMDRMFSAKHHRTKVFSGNKNAGLVLNGKFPSLFDLCSRVLFENFDALEYTGGVPYDQLKTILEKVTAEQLLNFEEYNPYLICDTDHLWEYHAKKKFRNAERQEYESWRELYLRCTQERSKEFELITAKIKLSGENAAPQRKTQCLYTPKTPTNIAKKQEKNGTAMPFNKLSPKSTSSTIKSVKERLKEEATVPKVLTKLSSNNAAAALKKKKAPLMQKTLQQLNRWKQR